MNHHDQLIADLQAARALAGGPISLAALLRLAMPTIMRLRANGVRWKWLGARVLAVHEALDGPITSDLPDLDPARVHYLVSEFSRQKHLADTAVGGDAQAPLTGPPGGQTPRQTAPPRTESRSPPTSARASIHAAAELNTSLRKLQS